MAEDEPACRRYGSRWTERSYDPKWESWLYERHPPGQLRDWATRLRWFRYCRAYGGHANDGDTLRLALSTETEQELRAVFGTLGIPPVRDPGKVHLNGEEVFVLLGPGRMELHLSDPTDPYEVTERTVTSAAAVEPVLATLAGAIIDPPLDNPHCVCPRYYPHLWRPLASR